MDAEQRPLSQQEAAGTERVLDEQSLCRVRTGAPSPGEPRTPSSAVPTGHGKPRDLGARHADSQRRGSACPQSARPQIGAARVGGGCWGRASFGEDKTFYN